MDTPRKITVITAGTEDWEPTGQELHALVETFMKASTDPAGAVTATRSGINVRVIDVSTSTGVVATNGWLSDDDIKACVGAYTQVSLNNLFNAHREIDGVAAFRAELDKRMNQE